MRGWIGDGQLNGFEIGASHGCAGGLELQALILPDRGCGRVDLDFMASELVRALNFRLLPSQQSRQY